MAEHALLLIFWASRGYRILCQLPSLRTFVWFLCWAFSRHVSLQCFGSASKSMFSYGEKTEIPVLVWVGWGWGRRRARWTWSQIWTILLKFDYPGDHFWLKCTTCRSNRWLRTSQKWPRHQKLQMPPCSWPVSVFPGLYTVSKDADGEALCQIKMHSLRRDSFNWDTLSG